MDATQMIDDSVLESDEEEEENDRGDALGKLCILKNPHIPEKECHLYLGENVLGRDPDACSVSLLAPSVSKQHATISLSVYRRKGRADEVEALLWDMGSMNGTRKGHLKLTPNVRYALSEGDGVVVADIPCKYTKSTTDVPETTTPVTPKLKARDVLRENGGNLSGNATKSPAGAPKKDGLAGAEGTRGTPARSGGLSFEQTPTQPQSSLAPDSESESEEGGSRAGDRRPNAAVSDSDSHKSSPICSTFTSPTNKVVPESEDESPITPSSSYKNRTRRVSFNTEESDSDIGRREREKTVALDIVDDSEEETGNDDGSVQPERSKVEPDAGIQANAISEFNMDSDTDVEEEEEKLTVANAAAAVMSSDAQASEKPKFHTDSDTDVEDNDDHTVSPDNIPKNSHTAPVPQPNVISMDSDTDVEEVEEKPTAAATPETSTGVQVSSNEAEFNMDSDTDVEDEDLVSAAKAIESQTTSRELPKTSADPGDFNVHSDTDVDEGETDITPATPSRLDAKSPTSKSATPHSVEFDSDTDDEGILGVPVFSKPPEDLEILSNSDTDFEGDSPDVKPTTSGLIVADCEVDSAAGTGVNESVVSSSAIAASVDSDTDVEDNEAEFKETEDDGMPVLQRQITPGIQGALLKNCSTPIQEGNVEELETQAFLSPSTSAYRQENVEELETQAFLSPSISAYRRAVAPLRTGPPENLSSCSSQEDEDVVAETQSFISNDKAQDPNISLGSSVNENDASNSSGGHFQLELSDSSALQCQAGALAMESTQAFINANLEETQPYADTFIAEEKNAPVDIAMEATQAYLNMQNSDEEEERAEGGQEGEEEEEEDEEATQPLDNVSVAPTQPTCGDSEDSARVSRQKTANQIQEEETQRFTNVTAAPTQPMASQDDDETDEETQANADITVAQTVPMETYEDSAVVFRKKKVAQIQEEQQKSDLFVAQTVPMKMDDTEGSDDNGSVFRKKKVTQSQEEATQQNSDLNVAQTVPMETAKESESDEDSAVFRKKKVTNSPEEETPQNSDLIVAQTVPMEMEDTEECDDDGPVFRKRTAKKIQSEEEATQSLETLNNEGTDDEEYSGPMFRKRKVKPIDTIEDTQSSLESEITVAPTQPIPATEDAIPVGRKRTAKKQNKEVKSELAPTQPVVLSDDGESDDEDAAIAPSKRKAGKLEYTQSLNWQETRDGGEASNVAVRARRSGRRLAKEKQEEEEEVEEAEPAKRLAKVEGKVAQVSKGRRGKAKVEPAEESDEEEEQEATNMSAKLLKEKEQNETGKKGKLEEKELEKERVEREKKELAAKLRKEQEREEAERREKLENERLEKERIKQEKKELAAKLLKAKEEKKQKEKSEKIERLEHEKRSQEEKEQRERAEREAKKQEEELQRRREEKQEDQAPRRGRRTGRRTIAVPDSSSSTVADEDDVPAKRTRSRSNSSNSVCSERSASSNVSQAGRGRGRGRGARKTEVEKTPSRGRRRTVAGTAEVAAPSPSSSEFSASNASSQGRGGGGRQRGRGRRTEVERANERLSSQQATQRGRKSTEDEDEGDYTRPSPPTRGKRGAKESSSKCADEQGEEASASGTEGRGGRIKRVGTKRESVKETLEVEENGEDEDASSSGKRKAAGRNTPARKAMKVTENDAKNDKPKGKAAQAKNGEKQGDGGSSANNATEREEEPPQTPKSSVSRKRSSADPESDSLPKTPRSSTASPSAGRARTATPAYKVLFTGVVDEDGESVLTRLGGVMAKDVRDMNCLVTDKVRRTVKFLCAVAKGIPIVTTQWLEKSGKAGTFLPPNMYLVKDREQENKFNFNLQESLRLASSRPLLQGYEIHVTKSVKPEPVQMKDIISCSGAVFLPKMPSSNKPNTVVVSCEEDIALCAPAMSRGLPVVSSEFIFTGILQQKLDPEIHKLGGPASAPTAGGRGRGRKKT